ncbi:hypothetical protein GCM10010844_40380 [Deinococcus radiotolerans]|uniref:Uncharacterized protein n=1 Tax=Deinococcus radiotolerans TaxID=1309407 RepID=A0ABQ2FQN2_9DEIO|nr:hypothetical protein GCM10010844_40380 [Deinococcus radiotolerans]
MPAGHSRSPLPPTGAFFTLPHGSLVHLDLVTRAWTPQWLRVSDERDMVPYRALQADLEPEDRTEAR